MKRTLSFMVMALALLLTQCRKPEVKFPSPVAPEGTTVSMTVTAGPGSKTDITTAGGITWSENDKLYVGFDGKYVGCLEITSGVGTPTGWFSGNVTLPSGTTGEKTFHFFYLGRDNDVVPSLNATTVDVSFATQEIYADANNKLANASKYHVGYGSAKGTVAGSEVTGINVTLVSKVALARFSFKKGVTGYSNALTLSGTGIYSSMTVGFDGKFVGTSGSTTSGISLTGSHSERYVMLVPVGTGSETLSFAGEGFDGSTTLGSGIESNKFYGREVAIEVKHVEFTVNRTNGTKVKFAPGNLYYNGADNSHKMNENLPSGWNFYGHQWDCYPSGTTSVTESMETNMFTWGYGDWSTVYDPNTYETGYTMTDWGTAPGLPSAGVGKTWRTLTHDEWKNLLGIGVGTSPRNNAVNLRAWVTLTDVSVSGLVILPDGSTVTASTVTTTALVASSGAVFLPAAGFCSSIGLSSVGSAGYYWSSTPYADDGYYAYYECFGSSAMYALSDRRNYGRTVRLVR